MEGAPHSVEKNENISLAQVIRRSLDIASVMVLIPLLCPLLCMAALAVFVESGGPVIFRQTRTGRNGKTFKIYKFRTMNVLEDGANVQQAICGDKRVTRVGRWLRCTSIDELPQLCNVLEGDMTLVGPRPHAVAHDEYYGKLISRYTARQRVKPGITGLAQVSGARGEIKAVSDMQLRVELDLWYIENQSLALDLKILLRTLFILAGNKPAF
jgi:exopolysaccharide biosynthesis polyprenyl glycosylphosphotransferase